MTRSKVAALLAAAVEATLGATAAGAHGGAASPLDGRWTFTWTPSMVKSVRGEPSLAGHYLVELGGGHLTRLLPHPVLHGARFTTSGDVATFIFPRGAKIVVPGRPYVMRWSLYRDRLTWSAVPGRAALNLFFTVPWTRVR